MEYLKQIIVKFLVFLFGVIFVTLAVFSLGSSVFLALSFGLLGCALIVLAPFMFPLETCNTCAKQLWIPLGTDHFFCALFRHPIRSAKGWYYHTLWFFIRKECYLERKERVEEEIKKEYGTWIEVAY